MHPSVDWGGGGGGGDGGSREVGGWKEAGEVKEGRRWRRWRGERCKKLIQKTKCFL